MGINSENNNNTENLKQQENLASAVDGVTSSAQQLASANTKVADSTRDMQDGIDSTTDKLDKMQEGLDKTLRSIHLLPVAIEEYTKTINKNMAYAREDLQEGFFKGILNEKLWGFRAELGRETEELKQAMEASKKSALQAIEHANKTGKEQDKQIADAAKLRAQQLETAYQNRKNMKFSQQLNIKLARDMKTQLLEIGKKMFSELWGYAKKLLDDAYSKDKSTIEQNYDTIMSLNSYNHGEYAKLIDRLQEKIDASGLGDVISVNTLQENLTKTMQMGLQGALAEDNAYYASIAEKAGITFDWYGTEWTNLISQMNRTGKDYEKVMKSVITTTDDLAEVYGDSTGLAGGRANQMMSAASTLGTTYGLSEEAIGNIYKSLAVTSQELTNYGIDTTNFVQDITGALESGLSNHDLGVIFGTGGATGDQVEQKIKEGKFDELIVQYMDNLEAMYNGHNSEMVNALQGALGSSFSNTDYQAFQTYWDQEGSFSANFEKAMGASNSDIEDINGELKNYVTTQESYETKMENALAGVAEWMVDNPIAEVINKTAQSGLASITQIFTTWLGNQALNKFLGGTSGGTGGGIKNAFSTMWNGQTTFKDGFKAGKNGSVLELKASNGGNGPMRWMKSDASLSDVTQTSGGIKNFLKSPKQGLSNLGAKMKAPSSAAIKAGGAMMIASGAIMGVQDSIAALNSAKADGKVTAGEVTNTGLAFLTGHNANLSEEEKMRKAKEGKGGLDWGAAFKNAGKGALIGGGAGMLASPIGGAIGAAAGALAGFAANAIQQYTDMKDYNEYAKSSLGKLSSSLDEASKMQQALTTSTSTYLQQVNALNDMESTLAEAQSGKLEMSDREIAILEKEIELQERKVALAARELGSAEDMINANTENAELLQKSQKGMGALENITDNIKIAGVNENTNFDTMDEKELKNFISEDEIQAMVDAGLIDAEDYKELGYEKTAKGILQTMTGSKKGTNWFDNIETDTFSMATAKGGTSGTLYKDLQDNANSAQTNMDNQITTNQDLIRATHELSSEADYKALQNAISGVITGYVNKYEIGGDDTETAINAVLKQEKSLTDMLSGLGSDIPEEDINKYKDWLKTNGIAGTVSGDKFKKFDGFFATGTDYVPYDNYLALLHRGEQVKTSAEVALDEAKHVASTNTQSAIHDVVLNQTNTIINLLTNIYQVLSSGRADPAKLSTKIKYDLPGAT